MKLIEKFLCIINGGERYDESGNRNQAEATACAEVTKEVFIKGIDWIISEGWMPFGRLTDRFWRKENETKTTSELFSLFLEQNEI